jgi:restriction system protein
VDLGVDVVSILEFFLPTLFAFWPVLILAPFTWKRDSIHQNLAVWMVLVFVRISLLFLPGEGLSMIPEPLNTILFLSAGLALMGIALIQRRRRMGKRNAKHIAFNSVNDFVRLKPEEFYMIVARIFRAMGHKVSLVGGQSVDLTVRTKKGEKWIIRCKNWGGAIDESAIRDLYGVLYHLNADRAALITSGTFTNQAVQWAAGKPIDLITGERLLEIWRTVTKSNVN